VTEPAELPEAVAAAVRRLASTARLLVAVDFDGTLAPIVNRPDDARALPAAAAAAARLAAAADTRVAYVSGRALASLREVADPPPGTLLVGSHGSELQLDEGEPPATPLDEAERTRLTELSERLAEIVGTIGQVWLERKPAGVAVHTRLATAADARVAQSRARAAAAAIPGLTVRDGKDVLEFSVRSATKGGAIEKLRRNTGATATLYAGDDVTDEDAFAVLGAGDVGVKVGQGPTAAPFRVTDCARFATLLGVLADERDDFLRKPTPEGS
jgi:trehalose 6-phosphate phosphatase